MVLFPKRLARQWQLLAVGSNVMDYSSVTKSTQPGQDAAALNLCPSRIVKAIDCHLPYLSDRLRVVAFFADDHAVFR